MKITTLVLLALLTWAPAASADMMYSYVGDTFRSNVAEPLTGVYTLSDYIRGSLVVADSFVPFFQAPSQNITPGVLSYSFTDGHQTLTEANSTATFYLNVVPTYPVLTRWAVSIGTPTSGMSFYNDGDRYDRAAIGTDSLGQNSSGVIFDGSHEGVWTATSVPEPATLVLLVAGLAFVAWRRP